MFFRQAARLFNAPAAAATAGKSDIMTAPGLQVLRVRGQGCNIQVLGRILATRLQNRLPTFADAQGVAAVTNTVKAFVRANNFMTQRVAVNLTDEQRQKLMEYLVKKNDYVMEEDFGIEGIEKGMILNEICKFVELQRDSEGNIIRPERGPERTAEEQLEVLKQSLPDVSSGNRFLFNRGSSSKNMALAFIPSWQENQDNQILLRFEPVIIADVEGVSEKYDQTSVMYPPKDRAAITKAATALKARWRSWLDGPQRRQTRPKVICAGPESTAMAVKIATVGFAELEKAGEKAYCVLPSYQHDQADQIQTRMDFYAI